jgi:5-methylthioadenosine/S-adenosylhomocysteine deaminase
MRKTVDTIIYPDWIVPVVPRGEVLKAHALVVDAGRIHALCPAAEARQCFQSAETVELPGHVVLPGLINSHGHSAMTLLRGIGDDLPLKPWLEQRIWPAESRFVDRQFVIDGTELAIAEMLQGGTTCCNDMYFFPDATAATAIRCGFRMAVGMVVIEFATRWASSADEYLKRGLALYDELHDQPLVSISLAPHAPYTVSDQTFQRIHTLADQLDIPVNIHLHETAGEISDSKKQYGLRPFARLQRLGLVNEHLLAVHMTQLSNEEIEACAHAGVSVVHCPESNQKLASGICPVDALARAGVNVCLGTDGAASNNDLDLFGEMRSAALLAKVFSGDATAIPAAQALEMATINGARALGMEAEIGSIEPGKSADLAVVSFDRVDTTPVYDVISHLVYATHRRDVTDVWVAGRRLLESGRLTSIDERGLIARAQQWGQCIHAGLFGDEDESA